MVQRIQQAVAVLAGVCLLLVAWIVERPRGGRSASDKLAARVHPARSAGHGRENSALRQRMALGPASLLVIRKVAKLMPDASLHGALLDRNTGQILRSIEMLSEPIDVLVMPHS
jgi:hypothetical protein